MLDATIDRFEAQIARAEEAELAVRHEAKERLGDRLILSSIGTAVAAAVGACAGHSWAVAGAVAGIVACVAAAHVVRGWCRDMKLTNPYWQEGVQPAWHRARAIDAVRNSVDMKVSSGELSGVEIARFHERRLALEVGAPKRELQKVLSSASIVRADDKDAGRARWARLYIGVHRDPAGKFEDAFNALPTTRSASWHRRFANGCSSRPDGQRRRSLLRTRRASTRYSNAGVRR